MANHLSGINLSQALKSAEAASELSRLAREITNHHDECVAAGTVMSSAHERFKTEAMLCGAKLRQAKELLAHGQFEDWVEKHCSFGVRMARNYMAAAAKRVEEPAPKAFTLTARVLLRVTDRWAGWLRAKVPDRAAILGWSVDEKQQLAARLRPLAELYEAVGGPETPGALSPTPQGIFSDQSGLAG